MNSTLYFASLTLFCKDGRMNRRTFLERTVKTLSGLITAFFLLPIWNFLRASSAVSITESTYPIGPVTKLQEEVTRVGFTRLIRDGWRVRTEQHYVWVRKTADGSVEAFEPHCTHLGCAFNWDESSQLFLCPCHGGKFDKDGKRVAGPPPRDLDRFEVKVEGGQVRIGRLLKG